MSKTVKTKEHKSVLVEFLEHPFIPKTKNHTYVLMLAGAMLILAGCVVQVKYSIEGDVQKLSAKLNELNSTLSKTYTPADIATVIPYTDERGVQRGTITVVGSGDKNATCGYGLGNNCSFYLNIQETGSYTQLTEYPILTTSFGPYSFKSIEQIDSTTFEIITERGDSQCESRAVHTMKVLALRGSIVSTEVDSTCLDENGKVLSTERYSTTTFEY